ncbi:hypothetical protein CCR75_008235 [Bremia lactucae]|uniref:Uncharacterized protein n=1 Tax=Bremia lactucae TaxID=4779 RepID=A0A976FJ70_BRELC|nr:hypothetical protein CCR75_008235 [Bremia lactucae]
MNDEERKALAESRGRVANLRAMFNKGVVTNVEPPAWKRRPPIKLPTGDKNEETKKMSDVKQGSIDVAQPDVLTTKELRPPISKKSSYTLSSDPAYNHAMKQNKYVRAAERKANESQTQGESDEEASEADKSLEQHRQVPSYRSRTKQRENWTNAEQQGSKPLRTVSGGKMYFEEQLDEIKRVHEQTRQREQDAKVAVTKNQYTSTEFDHAYVRTKEIAQLEKEAEGKAKAALLKFNQHDISHEMSMKNGMMISKHTDGSATPRAHVAKRYPFTDPSARIKKPRPQSIKALARFQEQLAESYKESARKMSIDSVESLDSVRKQSLDEHDLEQIKASVDDAKLDVKSAAQKFAEMDRKAANLAKQNEKPMTFNGTPYGHSDRAFRMKEKDRKERELKNDMAIRIQSRERGRLARKAYSERLEVSGKIAVRIQANFRRRQAQKHFQIHLQRRQREEACAVVIQKHVRCRAQRTRFQAKLVERNDAAVYLQCLIRTRQAQAAYRNQIKAVCNIQNFIARMLAGQKAKNEVSYLRKERSAAILIQSVFRSKAAKSRVLARHTAIVRLQCAWRGFKARQCRKVQMAVQAAAQEAQFAAHNSMAITIQSCWRSCVARSKVSFLRAEAAKAAVEEATRQKKSAELARQKEVARLEEQAHCEELARAEEETRQAEMMVSKTTMIQCCWRCFASRIVVSALRAKVAKAAAEEATRQEELAEQARQEVAARLEDQACSEESARGEEEARRAMFENSMATKIQRLWRYSGALVNNSTENISPELRSLMALKIQRRWRLLAARHDFVQHRQARQKVAVKAHSAVLIQVAWRGRSAWKKSAICRSLNDALIQEATQNCGQPTLAELQLLSQSGRFSNQSSDSEISEDESEFEDAPSSVDNLLDSVSCHLKESDTTEKHISSPPSRTPSFSDPSDASSQASSLSVELGYEFSNPEYHWTLNDDKSEASSDCFVDAMEEHKPTDFTRVENETSNNDNPILNTSPCMTNRDFLSDAASTTLLKNAINEEAEEKLSSMISDFNRPSSVRSDSSVQQASVVANSPRGSNCSSSLCSVSATIPYATRKDSYADSYTDSPRTRGISNADSDADSPRLRGVSFADSNVDSHRSRGDSFADSYVASPRSRNSSSTDVFRSRNNSCDEALRSRQDSYADVPFKLDFDENNLSDEDSHNSPGSIDADSPRESLSVSDSPLPNHDTIEIEKDEEPEAEREPRNKSSSRWRAASVLNALSSRRSSKQSSSTTSSLEDEEKDIDQKKARSGTLPSVAANGLSSVAGLINRKLSVQTNSNTSSSKSSEYDIEESTVISPPASKSRTRFGRFTAPTVSKQTFTGRFGWKSQKTRQGMSDEGGEER